MCKGGISGVASTCPQELRAEDIAGGCVTDCGDPDRGASQNALAARCEAVHRSWNSGERFGLLGIGRTTAIGDADPYGELFGRGG